jgi:hypothetical protein
MALLNVPPSEEVEIVKLLPQQAKLYTRAKVILEIQRRGICKALRDCDAHVAIAGEQRALGALTESRFELSVALIPSRATLSISCRTTSLVSKELMAYSQDRYRSPT